MASANSQSKKKSHRKNVKLFVQRKHYKTAQLLATMQSKIGNVIKSCLNVAQAADVAVAMPVDADVNVAIAARCNSYWTTVKLK